MLELEESRLRKNHKLPSAIHTDHSSSSSALTVTQPDKHHAQSQEQKPPKFNNFRDNKKHMNRYRGRNNNQFYGGQNYGNGQPQYAGSNFPYWVGPTFWTGPPPPWPNQFTNWTPHEQTPTYHGLFPSVISARPTNNNASHAHLMEIQPTGFTQAYTSETLLDPNAADWYMDSGANAHLTNTAGSSNTENSAPM
ncbi:hypothetical protein V5N11_007773 [Cardamine amara subsp. amara]|uniref:Uncharacterized protein n=1 Tax=Cardamine amara subsp. amara TaxID=228776 RepID=A0ABD1B7S9_CARAN